MNIKTWQERYISGVELGYTKATDAMQAEIDELREALKAQPVQPAPLTDAEIQTAITVAVKAGKLSWLGFDMDSEGKFTIPVLSPYHYQLARVIWNLRTGGAG